MTGHLTRRRFGRLILGAGATAPLHFVRAEAAPAPRPGDELIVGIWGGAQERLVRQYCLKPLEAQYGCKVRLVLGGTSERRARAYVERGRPSFDIVYLNIYESRQALRDGVTQLGGRVPVNTGGGLLSRGHPLGATGCAQLYELVTQLRGEAGPRQVDNARRAMAINGGGWLDGSYALAIATILERL